MLGFFFSFCFLFLFFSCLNLGFFIVCPGVFVGRLKQRCEKNGKRLGFICALPVKAVTWLTQ